MRAYLNKSAIAVSIIICAYFFAAYGKESYPFYGDSLGYYMYLPSTFIYHNHKALDWLPQDKHLDKTVRTCIKAMATSEKRTPKGYIINKYTYGVALMEMPFFFTAHAYEKIAHHEANGYSFAYRAMVKISSIVYALLGLFLLYKILRCFFSPGLSSLGVLIIFMGTNLFWFTLFQSGMAHVPLFFLYALLIYCTIRSHRQPKTFFFVIAGFAAGIITVIRPTDIICLLIPLLYNVYNNESRKQKLSFLKANSKNLLLFSIAFILPLIPQMLYWKKFAGSILYYSYGSETFTWFHPHIWDGLFSFANGWLIYSPAMVFSIAGLLFYKRVRQVATIIFILLPVYVYIIYSWYCYNYINGLGSRPMINIYPLLAIPLTTFLLYASERKAYAKVIFSFVFIFLIAINISYSFQQARGILFSEESNATYNLHMLFKMNASYNDLVMYDVQQVQPDSNGVQKITTLSCQNYEDSLSDHFMADPTGRSKYVYHMHADEEYHPEKIVAVYNKQQFRDAEWLKCSGTFLCPSPYLYFKHLFVADIIRGDSMINWNACKIDNKIGLAGNDVPSSEFTFNHSALNSWGYVYFFVKIPKGLIDGDKIRLDVWNIGKQDIYFDNICLELYKNRN